MTNAEEFLSTFIIVCMLVVLLANLFGPPHNPNDQSFYH